MSLTDSQFVDCPYCGEQIEIEIDTSVPEQQYIEDCQVCCRPMVIAVRVEADGISLDVRSENE